MGGERTDTRRNRGEEARSGEGSTEGTEPMVMDVPSMIS
jgi:hypothetical protein